MGYWSVDILGGDTPLDFEDLIYDLCNIDKFGDNDSLAKIPANVLEENLSKIIEKIGNSPDGKTIGLQVLGVYVLKTGAKITPKVKELILAACADDEWAKTSDKRREKTDELWKAIRSYDGNKVEIKSKGLIETIVSGSGVYDK